MNFSSTAGGDIGLVVFQLLDNNRSRGIDGRHHALIDMRVGENGSGKPYRFGIGCGRRILRRGAAAKDGEADEAKRYRSFHARLTKP